MGNTQRMRRRRRKLWERNPRCRFCKRVTVLPRDVEDPGGSPPPNMATIEHLDPKFSPKRGKFGASARPGLKERTVLACWECNNRMNEAEQARLPKERLWELSGSYPRDHPESRG